MSTHRAVEMFERVVLAVIVANTAVLVWGLLDHVHGDLIDTLHESFLLFFVAELAVRFAAAGFNPRRFLRSGWNSFDAFIVAVALLPMAGVGVTVLRVARAARLVHAARHVSALRLADLFRRAAGRSFNSRPPKGAPGFEPGFPA